jgi:hypothetical protein
MLLAPATPELLQLLTPDSVLRSPPGSPNSFENQLPRAETKLYPALIISFA